MILSQKLIELRKKAGLSQEELAIKLDISRQAVHKWETTQSKPDTEKLLKLSKLFGVTLDSLLDDESEVVFAGTKSKSYGKVYFTDNPESPDPEKLAKKLSDSQKGKIKELRKKSYIIDGIVIGILGIILILAELFFGKSSEALSNLILILGIAYVLLAPVGIIVNHVIFKKQIGFVKEQREYVREEANRELEKLYKSGYTAYQLAPDNLEFFIYSDSENKFGIYCNGNIQFFVPISNFISLKENPSGLEYDLKFYDENGEVIEINLDAGKGRLYIFDLYPEDMWKVQETIIASATASNMFKISELLSLKKEALK